MLLSEATQPQTWPLTNPNQSTTGQTLPKTLCPQFLRELFLDRSTNQTQPLSGGDTNNEVHNESNGKPKQPAPAPFPVYTQHPFQPTIGCPRFEHPPCLELECVASPKSSLGSPFEGLRNDKAPVATRIRGVFHPIYRCQYFVVVASILRPLEFIETIYCI